MNWYWHFHWSSSCTESVSVWFTPFGTRLFAMYSTITFSKGTSQGYLTTRHICCFIKLPCIIFLITHAETGSCGDIPQRVNYYNTGIQDVLWLTITKIVLGETGIEYRMFDLRGMDSAGGINRGHVVVLYNHGRQDFIFNIFWQNIWFS